MFASWSDYILVRLLPTDEWIGLGPLIFGWGLYVGLDQTGWRCYYSYDHFAPAYHDTMNWDGRGDPDGLWLKQKGRIHWSDRGERHNPKVFFGARVVVEYTK